MLAIWSLVPLPFLKPDWTLGSSWLTYHWSLAWRILSIILLVCAAAAAESLQSCPTLCDPIDGSPPGSPVPGILQARTLGWVSIWWVQLCSSLSFLWHCLSLRLEWDWPFPVLWPLLSFPNLLAYECSTFTPPSFRIWNSSTGIPSPPLALFVVMLSKAHLTSHSRMSGSNNHHCDYLGREDLFCRVLLCILATSS